MNNYNLLLPYLIRTINDSPQTAAVASLRFLSQFVRSRAKPIPIPILSQDTNTSAKKALRVLSLISPKSAPRVTTTVSHHAHLSLIEDFLQTRPLQPPTTNSATADVEFSCSDESISAPYEWVLDLSTVLETGDPVSSLIDLHRQGLIRLSDVGVFVVSRSLGACGSTRGFPFGVQLHCLSIRCGFMQNVYVGSSLVGLYSKCNDLDSARKLFDEMPERNVVSWSALISGFAQNWQINACLELYAQMRSSDFLPNDYTLTALLSACMGTGSLQKGRIMHCQTIVFGFKSYLTVSNAIISMYCKCGDVTDAFGVFNTMDNKDIVSWNCMIAGYSLHGRASAAIDLFEDMKRRDVKPDSISFLNILSLCRHAGLVDQGLAYFYSMEKYSIEPDLDHYSCLVDLLGRAGLLEKAREIIMKMPMQPNAVIWGTLLSCCRFHGDVWIGIEAAKNRLALEPECSATHVQLANMYARVGKWEEAARVRKKMKDRVMKTSPGYSWIEIGSDVYRFKVDDASNPKMSEVICILGILMDHLTLSDYEGESYQETLDSL